MPQSARSSGYSFATPEQEAEYQNNRSYQQEDLGEIGGKTGHSSEAEQRSDQSDDGKYDGPTEHVVSPLTAPNLSASSVSELAAHTYVPRSTIMAALGAKLAFRVMTVWGGSGQSAILVAATNNPFSYTSFCAVFSAHDPSHHPPPEGSASGARRRTQGDTCNLQGDTFRAQGDTSGAQGDTFAA
jgi:hypothetical protein